VTRNQPQAPIEVRSPKISFDGVPRRWLAGDPIGTSLCNAVNLLFPAGERFFVRSVHRYLNRLENPELKERVRSFSKQEGHHARAHEDWFANLKAQGYELETFLEVYQRICFGFFEKLAPAKLSLATTAAAEQFTAVLARDTIINDVFAHAAPAMRELLMWHSAEELEHKSVAYDVLQAVAPGYAWRAAGMAMGAGLLASFWAAGFALLLAQEKKLAPETREALRGKLGPTDVDQLQPIWEAMKARRKKLAGRVFLQGITDYLRPRFHPDEVDDRELMQRALESVGLWSAVPAQVG
jgi:predicted metal-dependent hydrolase